MRRLWWLPFTFITIAAIAGYATATRARPPTYTAAATLLVAPPQSTTYIAPQDLQTTVFTYAELVATPPVLDVVAETLESGLTGQQLLQRVQAEAIRETRLIKVSVSDGNADQSARIANEVAREFRRYVRTLGLDEGNATVAVVVPAVPPERPAPTVALVVGLAALAGIVAAVAVVFLEAYLEASRSWAPQRS